MANTTDNEIALIADIMHFFGLDAPTNITPVKYGISNHHYVVTAQQHEFVVKFLVNQRVETVENDVAIQQALRKRNIGTAAYLRNPKGTYLFVDGSHQAVISQKIDGVVPSIIHPPLAHAFGRALASFHLAVTHLPHPNTKGLMHPEISGVRSPLFTQNLPTGITHGDFHTGNVLVDPADANAILAIVDFEEAGENLYLVDLAVTVMGVCADNENAMDLELIHALLGGYAAIRPLSSQERIYFPEALAYAAQAWIQWFQTNGYVKYAKRHQQRLETLYHLRLSELTKFAES